MDYDWTEQSERPPKLYRVQRASQYTNFTWDEGWKATDLQTYCLELEQNKFIESIQDHRQQKSTPTPYISFFEDEGEAEIWAIAAENILGCKAYVICVDLTRLVMRSVKMWKVNDIAAQTHTTLYPGAESEWLVFRHMPREGIVGWKLGSEIRQQHGFNQLKFDFLFPHSPNQTPAACPQRRIFDRQDPPVSNMPRQRKIRIRLEMHRCGCLKGERCNHIASSTNSA